MPYYIELPNGSYAEVPDHIPQEQAVQDMPKLYPDAFADAKEPDQTFLGNVGEFAKGLPRGAVNTLLTGAEGAAGLVHALGGPRPEESLVGRGVQAAREAVDEHLGPKVGYDQSLGGTIGEAFGSFGAFALPGMGAAGVAGRGLAGLARTQAMARGATGSAAGLGALVGAGEQVSESAADRLAGKEIDPIQEKIATVLGTIPGAMEALPIFQIERFLKAVPDGAVLPVLDRIKRALVTGGAEGVQEVLQGGAQDLIQKTTTDPEQEFFQGAGTEFGAGATVGGGVQAAIDALYNRRVRGAQAQAAQEAERKAAAEAELQVQRTALAQEDQQNQPNQKLLPPPEVIPGENWAEVIWPQPDEDPRVWRQRLANIQNVDLEGPFQVATSGDGFVVRGRGKFASRVVPDADAAGEIAKTLNERALDDAAERARREAPLVEAKRVAEAGMAVTGARGTPTPVIKPEDIHALATEKKIRWNQDPGFLRLSREITGESHLDKMNPAQLENLHAALAKLPAQPEWTPLKTFNEDQYRSAVEVARTTGSIEPQRLAKEMEIEPAVAKDIVGTMVRRGAAYEFKPGDVRLSENIGPKTKPTPATLPEGKPELAVEELPMSGKVALVEPEINYGAFNSQHIAEGRLADVKRADPKGTYVLKNGPEGLIHIVKPERNHGQYETYDEARKALIAAKTKAPGSRFKIGPAKTTWGVVEKRMDGEGNVIGSAPVATFPTREAAEGDLRGRLPNNEPQAQEKVPSPPKVPPRLAPAQRALQQRLAGMGLQDVAVRASEGLQDSEGNQVEGIYHRKVIALSEAAARAKGAKTDAEVFQFMAEVMDHEAIHALRELGVITPDEWNALVGYAQTHGRKGGDTFVESAAARYKDLDQDAILEEAVADAFRFDGKGDSEIKGIVNKIVAFLQKMIRMVRAGQTPTAQDVMAAIRAGEVGGRERVQPKGQDEKFSRANPDELEPADREAFSALRKWAGKDTKIFPEGQAPSYEGGPAVFYGYHGTTHGDITEIEPQPRKGSSESFLGRGFYITTGRMDANSNYAGQGPDLRARISKEASRIQDGMAEDRMVRDDVLAEYFEDDPEFRAGVAEEFGLPEDFDVRELPDETVEQMNEAYAFQAATHVAGKGLSGDNQGFLMPVWVRVLKPFDMRHGGLQLTYKLGRDEEGDVAGNIGEPEGTLADLIKAVRETAQEWGANVDYPLQYIEEEALDFGGMTANEFWRTFSQRGDPVYDPDTGDIAHGDFMQDVFRKLGYDGIVMDAGEWFGRTQFGGGMMGVTEGVLHIVPFGKTQVKSALGNRGTFDDTNPDIRYSRPAAETNTSTEEFRKWFGQSKIVEKDGSPMRVYHGTPAAFDEFDTKGTHTKVGMAFGVGAYFSSSPDTADIYSGSVYTGEPRIIPAYLSLQNPLIWDVEMWRKFPMERGGRRYDPMPARLLNSFRNLLRGGTRPEAIRRYAEQRGHDGVMYVDPITKRPVEIIVFSPTQVKSVFNPFEEGAGSDPKFSRPEVIAEHPGFQKWFDGSKVVSPAGLPKVVYHGTSKDTDFKKFKVGPRGAWFTEDPNSANEYAEHNDSQGHKYDGKNFIPTHRAARVIPAYLSIKNPYTPTDAEMKTLRLAGNYRKAQSDLFLKARAKGHDGVSLGHGVWVAFNPTQIKSIFNEFGPGTENDPRFSRPAFDASLPAEPGYIYHATTVDNLRSIADDGRLGIFGPSHGTDQSTWPDGMEEDRAYFGPSPKVVQAFLSEGAPALVRTKRTDKIKQERHTKDLYVREPVPASELEYLGDDGKWHPVTEMAGPDAKFARAQQKVRTKVADKVWSLLDKPVTKVFDPLGFLPNKTDYKAQRRKVLGKITAQEEHAREVYETFAKADKATQDQVYAFLTTKGSNELQIKNPKVRKVAVQTKAEIERIGQDLVDHGLLKQETVDKYKGEYLPNVYLKWLMEQGGVRLSGIKPSDMPFLRNRKDLPAELQDVLGKVTDPGFLSFTALYRPQRDLAILDFYQRLAGSKDWVLPDSVTDFKGMKVTRFWLMDEAASARVRAKVAPKEQADKMMAAADEMEKAAAPMNENPEVPQGFVRLPNKRIYGALRNAVVRKEIANDIAGAVEFMDPDAGWAQKLLGQGGVLTKATSYWKAVKVTMNPPTQIRNAISNMVMLNLSGVPIYEIPSVMARAIGEMRSNGKYWKIAKANGVKGTSFTENELSRMQRELVDVKARSGNAFWKTTGAIQKVFNFTGDAYQGVEAVFKTAKIIHAMESGMTQEQAAEEADKYLFDYSLVHPSVRYLRNAPLGMPFITYYYKSLPVIMETAVKHPLRFAPYVALIYGLAEAFKAMWDVEEKDIEALREALPDYLRRKNNLLVLPWKDDNGRWQFMDVGYFFPWAMHQDLLTNLSQGRLKDAMTGVGILGGPTMDIVAAITTGVDPFTGKPILKRGEPPVEQLTNLITYMWSLAAPPFLTVTGAIGIPFTKSEGKLTGALLDRVKPGGEPGATEVQGLMNFFGFNSTPIEPQLSRFRNITYLMNEIEDVKRERTKVINDMSLKPEEKKNKLGSYNEYLTKKYRELRDYAEKSQVPSQLRTQRNN